MGLFARAGQAIASAFANFGALGAAPPTPPTMPNGGDGVQAYGGFLLSDEARPELVGQRKWLTYSNATNTQIVATGLRRTLDMLAGTEWHCEPNAAGGPDAERAADLVTKGLLKARLTKPWSTVVRKAALYRYYGFSLHEWTVGQDSFGDIVFTDISHRPQYTIDRWDKPSEQMPWLAVSQLTKAGNRFVIPRGRLFHAVDDLLTDAPDGVGVMRHVIELVRRLGILEGLEGLAYETDLRGMPMGRAPIGELVQLATSEVGNDRAKIEAFVQNRTQTLRSALQGIVKSPEKLQYLLLDSATYQGADPNTISSIQKWAFDLLKGESNGVDTVAAAIGRIQVEIARVLGIEHIMMGSGGGSRAMHEDKTDAFATMLQTMLTEIAAFATNDLARVLVGLNGLDPDTCTPTLVAQPIDTDTVESTCQALSLLAQAALQPDDDAIKVLRARMKLPPPPEPTPEQLGLLGQGPGAPPPNDMPPDGEPSDDLPRGDQEPIAGPGSTAKRAVWYDVDDLDTGWMTYDIAKDFSPDQARDDHGMWTSGGGSGGGHGAGYSGWTRSFDSRAHDKQIDAHRATEEKHRAAGAKVKDQIAGLKVKAKDATPKQQAALQRKADSLKQQYDQHKAATLAARDARRAVQSDLERAKGEHTAARLAVAGARREHEADVGAHEAAGGIAIGGTRIGGDHESTESEHDVTPTAEVQHYAETPDHYMGIGTGEGIRAEPEPEAAPKPRTDTPNYRTASDRQVVSYASTGPKTQAEWNAHDQKQREAREAGDQRMRDRQAAAAAAKPAPEPKQEPLPEARTTGGGLLGRLRSMFGRKTASIHAVTLTTEDEALLAEFEAFLVQREEQDRP